MDALGTLPEGVGAVEKDLRGANLLESNLLGANLSGANLEEADLSGAHLEEADLSGATLWTVDLSGANLWKAKYTTDEIFNLISHLKNWERLKITDFRFLDTTKVDGSKNPLLKRHMEDYQFIQAFKEKDWIHKRIIYPLWKLTCDCGRSLPLWAFWSFVLALIFGLIYAPICCPSWLPEPIKNFLHWTDPQIYIDPNTYPHPFWTPIYFSIVTFTTLGFGDVQPQNLAGLIWVSLEVILGYIMLGGLISIFANKLARRA